MSQYDLIKPFFQTKLIYQFIYQVFPLVKKELSLWQSYAERIPDPILSQQALSSIKHKSFHAQGGCIYSLYNHSVDPELIRFIVALQTISDYLDNLCDRVSIEDEVSFLQLHLAITDALSPENFFSDYYACYPYKEDGEYLKNLVSTCKAYIRKCPAYNLIQEEAIGLGKLYSEMQSFKHISLSEREKRLKNWAEAYLNQYDHLSTWEFSAAAGSTLGIFFLCALARNNGLSKKEVFFAKQAYFPWICGFHILLDYFIDQKEDFLTGDLNFVSYYSNETIKKQRLLLFLKESLHKISSLPNPLFHITVIEGLLAMYLSDPKAGTGLEKIIGTDLLKNSSQISNILYGICKLLRRKKIIA